jgi:hypothetical protein
MAGRSQRFVYAIVNDHAEQAGQAVSKSNVVLERFRVASL